MGIECEKECKVTLNGEVMEEASEFMYLGTVMCKHGRTEGETRERALQGNNLVGSLEHIMKGKSVSMVEKRDLRNTVILPTLTYASETWAWNKSQAYGKHRQDSRPNLQKRGNFIKSKKIFPVKWFNVKH